MFYHVYGSLFEGEDHASWLTGILENSLPPSEIPEVIGMDENGAPVEAKEHFKGNILTELNYQASFDHPPSQEELEDLVPPRFREVPNITQWEGDALVRAQELAEIEARRKAAEESGAPPEEVASFREKLNLLKGLLKNSNIRDRLEEDGKGDDLEYLDALSSMASAMDGILNGPDGSGNDRVMEALTAEYQAQNNWEEYRQRLEAKSEYIIRQVQGLVEKVCAVMGWDSSVQEYTAAATTISLGIVKALSAALQSATLSIWTLDNTRALEILFEGTEPPIPLDEWQRLRQEERERRHSK